MKFHTTRLRMGLAAIAIPILSLEANAGFCSHYDQTWSNAGPCSHCQLSVKVYAESQLYVVHASNGWMAELTFVDGDSSVATGGGTWRDDLPHAYAGKDFDIDLTQQGNELSMIMSTEIDGQRQIVDAKFACAG